MEVNVDTPAHEKPPKGRRKGKKDDLDDGAKKRRCISSACVPCRKRKSKVRFGLYSPLSAYSNFPLVPK